MSESQDKVFVLLRNDEDQVLLLEDLATGEIEAPWGYRSGRASHPAAIREILRTSLGLDAAGLYPLTIMTPLNTYYFSGYVSGGKLKTFPTETSASFSWVSPTMALRLPGLSDLTRRAFSYLVTHPL